MVGDEWLPWIALETIHLGAEAEVISGTWIGRDAVLKRRIPRGYRHPVLEGIFHAKGYSPKLEFLPVFVKMESNLRFYLESIQRRDG